MGPHDMGGLAPNEAAAYLEEIAVFLAVHLGRGAGVLWPEHRHPVLNSAPDSSDLARLSRELSQRTGLIVCSTLGAEGAETDREHTLVQQVAGGSTWLLTAVRGSGPRTVSLRLYPGDVLYIPPAYHRVAVATADDSVWIVTALR